MDELDARRLEHAGKALAQGRAALATSPDQGLYWIKSALRLRAATLVRLADPGADDAIRELVTDLVRAHRQLGVSLPLTERNELVVLALALRERVLARDALAVPAKADAYPFTIALDAQLQSALATAAEPHAAECGALEPAELAFIESIARREVEGAERFWSLTRRKRFANTIHEHRNFYAEAVAAIASD